MAGGQAYTIQGNYAVPATPDVSNSTSGCSAVQAATAAVAAVMSSSLSPTSSSSTPSSTTSAYTPQCSSSSSSATTLHSSLGGCCSLPRFPAGMGLSMMHSHDFCSAYSPTPTTTCPMIGFGHHYNPQATMSMMQEVASCTSHSNPSTLSAPSSLCSSSASSPAYHHHQHPTTLVPWLSNHHQATSSHQMFAVSPVSSMTSPPAACSPIHPSKNGTISLATVSVPLSFYLGGDGSGRVMTAPPHGSSHVPSGLTAAYSAYSASPVHMDVSLGFLADNTDTHADVHTFFIPPPF